MAHLLLVQHDDSSEELPHQQLQGGSRQALWEGLYVLCDGAPHILQHHVHTAAGCTECFQQGNDVAVVAGLQQPHL